VDLTGILRAGGAGLAAGFAAGAVARLSMRIIALAGGQTPGFSLSGTLFILFVFGVFFGIPLGWLYAALSTPQAPNQVLRPLLISLGCFLFFIFLAAVIGADSEELAIVPGAVAIAAFLPVPLTHSLAYTLIRDRIEQVGFLAQERAVDLPSFLLIVAGLSWAVYALSGLADAGRTPPMPVFRALLDQGLGPSTILALTEMLIYVLGLALIAIPLVNYWRDYRSSHSRRMILLVLGGLGGAFWLISRIS
jgi:hypothetical protein